MKENFFSPVDTLSADPERGNILPAAVYRRFIDSLRDPVFVADPATGVIIDANREAQDFLGKTVEEIRGVHRSELHPMGKREQALTVFSDLVSRGGGRAEVVILDRAGREVIAEVSTSVIRVDDQSIVQEIFRDISRQARIEKALREAYNEQENIVTQRVDGFLHATQSLKHRLEEHYLSFMNNFHGIAFRCSMDLVPRFIHGEVKRITGYTENDFLSRRIHWGQLTHPGDRLQVSEMISRLGKGPGRKVEERYRIVRKNGEIRWVVIVARSVPDHTGVEPEIEGAVYDVTESNRLKDLLAEKEETYRTLVENLNIGVFRTTAQTPGRFMTANPAMARIFGYDSVEEFLKNPVAAVYRNPADRLSFLDEVAKSGFVRNCELPLKKRDGTPIWCSLTGIACRDPGGTVKWIDGVIEDITEHKATKQALEGSERRFRAMLENTGTAMMIFEEDMSISFANSRALEISGYTAAEIGQKNLWMSAVAAADYERFRQYHRLRRTDSAGAPRQYEYRIVTKRGDERDIFFTVDLIPGTNQSVVSFMDVTENRELSRAFKESENRYRAIVEDQAELICRFSPDHCLTFVNMAFTRYFPETRDEILGRRIFALFHEEDQELLKNWLSMLCPEHPSVTFEQRALDGGGKIRWQEWTCRALFDDCGTLAEYQGVGRDITARKQAEEELLDREKELAKRNRNLEEMNIALNVLFNKMERDKRDIEDNIITNLRDSVLPYLEKLKKWPLNEPQEVCLKAIEKSMGRVTSSFMKNLKMEYPNLSPKERQIADLIKNGRSTKEIAALMNLSLKTIEFYREKLRIRVGIKKKKVNLKAYLHLLD